MSNKKKQKKAAVRKPNVPKPQDATKGGDTPAATRRSPGRSPRSASPSATGTRGKGWFSSLRSRLSRLFGGRSGRSASR